MSNMINKTISNVFLQMADILENGASMQRVPIAVTAMGSEHGEDLIYHAAKEAADQGLLVKLIGSQPLDYPGVEVVSVSSSEEGHKRLESLLDSGEALGGVTMHYPFPIGVSTVGRVITPATGKEMFIATTTGTTALDRVEGMVRNAIYGIVTAKACGIQNPTVGILNVDGARQAEIALQKLQAAGYPITFAQSRRSDGGAVMRGNDLLAASCDVMVTDPLTGNLLMKLLAAYTTGGNYESLGYGYGPGLGEGFDKLILIISRASGMPVARGAMVFAAQLVKGGYQKIFAQELAAAKKAGLDNLLAGLQKEKKGAEEPQEIKAPPKVVVTEEIMGIEILDLEDAVRQLWAAGIYAESGMGCTGPVVLVAEEQLEQARSILADKGYIGS
ncbi:glycine/sarcosine/betaine reductase complex component C subunit alpha [Desulfosporosinus nitroreducens]|uniref:Glycine/sarcosine/betaine reductase complex component C subunit alpha n=2 Tax=Desulfosporosinus nitroreducens TaxID=2018668 RepID=A0ABT8QWJ8_9FIRM|nr:glycine/sarcosine/betaine reductase complex component C subunit alpha [Desulfosporosinus nitroreducens]MCO1602041.1 glycine/sarcosine/betaine reductase complex component C subunit alpha [Desulfosporosinus nitroreducens]MDO0825727.1 glycine/sarcosine/betaine reductase complex component C subunit alpha [Desulfosporosinus nitroreducens]